MTEDLITALSAPTVDLLVAGQILGISRSATYRARKNGDIPFVKIGAQYRVPSAKLREMLGLPPQTPIAA